MRRCSETSRSWSAASASNSSEPCAICWCQSASSAKVSGGSVVESSTVAHGATLAGGQSETLSANLKPGRYELVCHMPGHYAAGQHIPFTVR